MRHAVFYNRIKWPSSVQLQPKNTLRWNENPFFSQILSKGPHNATNKVIQSEDKRRRVLQIESLLNEQRTTQNRKVQ